MCLRRAELRERDEQGGVYSRLREADEVRCGYVGSAGGVLFDLSGGEGEEGKEAAREGKRRGGEESQGRRRGGYKRVRGR